MRPADNRRRLTIDYGESGESLGSLSPFVIDLDPLCTQAVILIRYELEEGHIYSLFADFPFDVVSNDIERAVFFKAMKERFPSSF